MKKLVLFLLLLGGASLSALTVADGGKSDYQIVVPDPVAGEKFLHNYISLGGQLIQSSIRKASGAELPLVTESKKIPGKPAIFVGNTRAAAKAGLSSGDFKLWEHAIVVKGKDIFCYGKDLGNPFKNSRYPGYYKNYVIGSLKAACTFVEKFANTRIIYQKHLAYGEHDGVRALPQKKIALPDKFSYRRVGRFRQSADMGGLLFSVANNFYFGHGEAYDVHYHERAIPNKKYSKSNPEYFAIVRGKRFFHPQRPQYCLSNPKVQELIYQNALQRADIGYRVVELGQSDGFMGCECEPCKKMYNTDDWGEKLWRLHIDMAVRLEKDRPGVIPAISCYGPTHKIPDFIKKFPTKRMIIDVAPATPKLLEQWKKYNIDGLAAWTYYFGSYRASSYAPAVDFEHIVKEVRWLRSTPMTYLYNCGITHSPALNGPWIYVYGKLCDDSELDYKKLLKDYCLFAYGAKAAPIMEKFFMLLDERSKKFPPSMTEDYNDFNRKRLRSDVLWHKRYTPDVLARLKKYFSAAEKVWIDSLLTKQLKVEFTYLLLTADVNNAGKALQENNSLARRRIMADRIEKRDAFLNSLPRRSGHIIGFFNHPRIETLRAGGNLAGVFGGAFDSDPKNLRQETKYMQLVKVKDFNDPAWKKIPAQNVIPLKPEYKAVNAAFKAAFTDKALLLICTAPLTRNPDPAPKRDSTTLWRDAVWELFVAPGPARFQMVFSAAPKSAFDAMYNHTNRRFDNWNGKWSHKDSVKNGIWRSEVTVPFASGIPKPVSGGIWNMQLCFSAPGSAQLYAWNLPLTRSFNDISGFGKVRFGEHKKIERHIDINLNKSLWKYNRNPKTKLERIRSNGRTALKFTCGKIAWGRLGCHAMVPVERNEKVVFTVTLRGKGKGFLGAAWYDNGGNFIGNYNSGINFTLSEKPVTFKVEYTLPVKYEQKGAQRMYPNIFMKYPGGELIVEKAELKTVPIKK